MIPGEFRDVDAPAGEIRNSLVPLPYKEPSQTLFQLLGFVIESGKSFAAVADMKLGEGNEVNPVGTTMALLERGMKVMSAIHKRMHSVIKLSKRKTLMHGLMLSQYLILIFFLLRNG